MTYFFKIGLLATTILASGALSLAAETTVAPTMVPLNATTSTVVGTTAKGDLLIQNTTYTIMPVPMTEAEIAAVNSDMGASDGNAPGPYVGWMVNSADKLPLGMVTYSAQDSDGKISTFNMLMPDGRGIRIENGIGEMGKHTIELRITRADVMANATSQFSSVIVQ